MTEDQISQLLGFPGGNGKTHLEVFERGMSIEFTMEEGCERLELALDQIKRHPDRIPEYQGPVKMLPAPYRFRRLVGQLEQRGMTEDQISQLLGFPGGNGKTHLEGFRAWYEHRVYYGGGVRAARAGPV